MTLHPFTTRASILGLPIGPRGLDWSSVLGSAVALASVLGTVETGLAMKHRVDELRKQWSERLREGKEFLAEGEEVLHHAAGIAHAVSTVSNAVPKAAVRK